MRRLPANAGLTLLEVMFAAGVLAMALSLLFGSLLSMNVVGQISESRTSAASQLASVLEELREMPIEQVVNYTPPELYGPGVSTVVSVGYYDADDGFVLLPLAGDAPLNLPNPLQVKAELIWTDERDRLYSMEAVTYHAR